MTWVTVVLLLALSLGGYLCWVWGPVWIIQFEAKQVLRDFANQAVKNSSDEELIQGMVHKLRALSERAVVDENGRVTRAPIIEVGPKGVVWERDSQTSTLHIALTYTHPIRYPFIERLTEKEVQIDLTMDISRPDWGPAR